MFYIRAKRGFGYLSILSYLISYLSYILSIIWQPAGKNYHLSPILGFFLGTAALLRKHSQSLLLNSFEVFFQLIMSEDFSKPERMCRKSCRSRRSKSFWGNAPWLLSDNCVSLEESSAASGKPTSVRGKPT